MENIFLFLFSSKLGQKKKSSCDEQCYPYTTEGTKERLKDVLEKVAHEKYRQGGKEKEEKKLYFRVADVFYWAEAETAKALNELYKFFAEKDKKGKNSSDVKHDIS